MKITHLVTLLACFTLSLSLPLSVNHLPVTTTRATTRDGTTTPDRTVQFTTTARPVTSSTEGSQVETTIATEVTSSPAVDMPTTRSAKSAESSSPLVGTTHSDSAGETSVAGTTTRTSAATTTTHHRLRRTIPETTTTAPSTATSRETPASTTTLQETPASTTTQKTPASTATPSSTPSARRGPTRDPRCTVRASDIGRHSLDDLVQDNTESAAVGDRALCKFDYKVNIDRQRHPETMIEVVCPVRKCGHCGGDGRCEPVYHHFKVLRRCDDFDDAGLYTYRYDYERLAIACVCATPALSAGRPVKLAPPHDDDDDMGPAPVLD